VLFLARDRAGVASDAAVVIDDKSVAQCVTLPCRATLGI
jgi:hypothetical protein